MGTESSAKRSSKKSRTSKYQRARIRRFLFTQTPDRLSRGRITKKHLSRDIILREIDVENSRWPAGFEGFRIGHVSDFHLGPLMPIERALEVVKLLEEQEPDLVACTGDVIDLHAQGSRPLFDALANVPAPLGSLLVLGNHDVLEDAENVVQLATEAGMIVLRNESIEIAHNGEPLLVAGVDWAQRLPKCSRNVDVACDETVHLLLSHNPKSFRRAAQIGIPLTLAGHTHGGQVAMKNRPNANLSFTYRHSAGLFEEKESHLFVTTGVGSWFPLRVNCPPEVVVLNVKRKE